MSKAIKFAVVCVFVLAGLAAAGVKVKQDSPQDTVESFIRAQSEMDWDAGAKLAHPDYRKVVVTAGEGIRKFADKCMDLADAVEKVYGKKLAEQIRSSVRDAGKDAESAALLKGGHVDWSKVKIEQAGDKATATIAGRDRPLNLVRVDKKWHIIPASLEGKSVAEAQAEADAARAQFDQAGDRVEALTRRVKAKSLTEQQFAEEFAKAMPGAGPAAPPTSQPDQVARVPLRQATAEQAAETLLLSMTALDYETMSQVIVPEYQKAIQSFGRSVSRLVAAAENLASAAQARLSAKEVEIARRPVVAFQDNPAALAIKDGRVDWTKVRVEAKGDKATAKIEGEEDPLQLVRIGDKWFANPTGEAETPEQLAKSAEALARDVDQQVPRLEALAQRVRAGQVKAADFEAEMNKAMGGK